MFLLGMLTGVIMTLVVLSAGYWYKQTKRASEESYPKITDQAAQVDEMLQGKQSEVPWDTNL